MTILELSRSTINIRKSERVSVVNKKTVSEENNSIELEITLIKMATKRTADNKDYSDGYNTEEERQQLLATKKKKKIRKRATRTSTTTTTATSSSSSTDAENNQEEGVGDAQVSQASNRLVDVT